MKLCPTSHYLDAEKKECLPCAFSCYGCKGPADTIGEKGCTDCNSALVDNDNSFTVLKCILWNNTCPPGYFHDVVNLKDHPLKGRDVCKKCHDECDECNGSGNSLSHGCIKCKNFYSKNSNRCVKNCSIYNEHLKVGSNVIFIFYFKYSKPNFFENQYQKFLLIFLHLCKNLLHFCKIHTIVNISIKNYVSLITNNKNSLGFNLL